MVTGDTSCGRTIPAGAGSRLRPARRVDGVRDHPRGRGEQAGGESADDEDEGPSPRARGAGHRVDAVRAVLGTIPAGAGSSRCSGVRSCGGGDHPRGRGEQACSRFLYVLPLGPSPRARGAVHRAAGAGRGRGTIPAGAGSRSRTRRSPCPPWDHPRGRGEQDGDDGGDDGDGGPSPRARGAVDRGVVVLRQGGTIPAGAGSRLLDLRFRHETSGFCISFTDSDKPHIRNFRYFITSCRNAVVWTRCSSLWVEWSRGSMASGRAGV